jgi:DNA-binding HxlR family transcriptional regulator
MVRRTSHEEASCPIARPLDVIGDGWSLLIIRDAFDGLRRFGQFQKSLGLAKNILSARLHNLVVHGILTTAPAEDGSSYREYLLTDKGRGLFPVLTALRQWGDEFCFQPNETRARLLDRQSHEPVAKVQVRSADGRVLTPEDTLITLING